MNSKDNFFIKDGYTARTTANYFEDSLVGTEGVLHQPHVYAFAGYLAKKFACTHILDIGCGRAVKLADLHPDFEIVGVDIGSNIEYCRSHYGFGTWLTLDLETAEGDLLSPEVLQKTVLVCSDVIEHLVDPKPLLGFISRCLDHAPVAILSTPERDLVRGVDDAGPPANTAHVREWNQAELGLLLQDFGFDVAFLGLTCNNNRDWAKKTTLAVLHGRALPPRQVACATDFRVVAFMTAYNEADIIFHSIRHLIDQGVDVYLIDNWSTDDTVAHATPLLGKGLIAIEQFPPGGPTGTYDWHALLTRVEELAQAIQANWYLHHDADEIREAPWSDMRLREAFAYVERMGFNAVDHTVIEFRPVDDGFESGTDYGTYFRHWEFGCKPGHFKQVKAWRSSGVRVDLARSGGHEAAFEDRRVFPYKFLLRHYPVRSQGHGVKKVFAERKQRFNPLERVEKGWHVHYDDIVQGHNFVRSEMGLSRFEEETFCSDYLVERLSGLGILDRPAQPRPDTARGIARLTVVLGMHRSGTSALTRALQALGVDLGESLIPGVADNNEKGFFEDTEVNKLNNELLEALGANWHTLTAIDPAALQGPGLESFRVRAAELLGSKIKTSHFGLKDPRLSRLLPFWQTVFETQGLSVSYVISVRNPLSVAQSLARRDGFTVEKSGFLWLGHVIPAVLGTSGAARIVVDYDRLMADPVREMSRLARALGLPFHETARSIVDYCQAFLESRLQHNLCSAEELRREPRISADTRAAYELLRLAACDDVSLDDAETVARFEGFKRRYDDMATPFAYMDAADRHLADCLFRQGELQAKLEGAEGQLRQLGSDMATVQRALNATLATNVALKRHLDDLSARLTKRDALVFQLAQLLTEDVQMFASIRQTTQKGNRQLLTQTINKASDGKRVAGVTEVLREVQAVLQDSRAVQAGRAAGVVSQGKGGAGVDETIPTYRIGIMAHVYYVDLFDEICAVLARFPYPYALLVSVVDEAAAETVRGAAAQLANLTRLDVRVVANRGRDLAPFFVAFRDDILALDLVCHVHTKKSLYTGTERTGWRQYLYQNLLGTPERVGAIFGRFAADPKLGVVYPESYPGMPFWGHTWLSNKAIAMQLAQRLGYRIDPGEYLDFPAGSMFWARPQALKPLFDLNLGVDSFPVESGQTDGTLQHALERYLGVVPALAGYTLGVLADDGSLRPTGGKNWRHHLAAPLAGKLVAAAARARIVSVDVFDTLVMRPFLHPDVVFDFIGEFLQARHGLADFKRLRKQAEARARQAKGGRDVDLDDIYASFQAHFPADPALIDELKEIEQGMELWFTRPRSQPIRLLRQLAEQGMRIVAVSDMYLPAALIRRMLDHVGADFVQTLYLSSETGWRKDTGEAWRQLPVREGVEPGAWLHVGDNEHSDIQLPVDAGFLPPVHILRPAAMLATLPCLSALHRRDFLPWPDQLWLGLVGNRLAELSDRSPAAFGDALRLDGLADIGYLCFGPVVANYVLWLARRCAGAGHRALLFLSREGYLLEKVFAALQASIPALAGMQGRYFLTSRRAAGVAAMQTRDDLGYLLGAHFKGRVGDLIRARFGDDILAAYRAAGDLDLDREVTLPAMKDAVLSGMLASRAAILEIAARERAAYLDYWRAEVPDGPAALSDLGFSGTIQKFLMALTGRKLDGFYFATTAKVAGLKQLGVAVEGLYGDGVALQHAGVPVFDYSLILEAVLTAPAGQFQHFERSGEGLRPVFKQAGHSQTHFDRVAAIQQGMLDFVADLVAAVGERIYDAEFDRDLVQVPLRLLVDGTWSLGEHEALFSVEDDFSGFGEISCFQHYRRLAERPGPAEPAGRAEGPAETG
ncbi:rhamnan synthesis F family protein [Parasulfuritortus cantonensis]|uniref:rhamnan synthesis F family protein n=1 Tax=Parasulfuritortus cantonensis TaxID=2528202 RepID=UPI00140476AE|nr:rhamnan synthesis F family protein [Parasulfuritortus cantonensis]